MRVGLLMIEISVFITFIFISSALRISSIESGYEEEKNI